MNALPAAPAPSVVSAARRAAPGRKRLIHPLLLCGLLVAMPAWAEPSSDAGTDDTATPRESPVAEGSSTREDEPVITERVVVTATRVETPLDETGSSMTVLERDDLARKQRHLVEDVLSEVPGVDVRRTGGPGSTTSIFMRGADPDHTLVLVDGIEINDPSTPSGAPFIDHLTLDNVERIEVLRGPQSTLYGSDAIGGAINIITESGGEPRSSFWIEGGSYSSVTAGFSSSGKTDALRWSVGASHGDSAGFSASSSGTENDPYRNTTVAGRLGADLSDTLTLDLVLRHLDTAVDFDGFGQEEDHRIDARQTLAKLAPRLRSFGGRWEQTLGLTLARHERDTRGSLPSVIDGRRYGLDWQNDLRLAEGQTLTAGVNAEWEKAGFPVYDGSAHTLGLYAQHQLRSPRWFGTIGLRVDDHSEFGSKGTWRFTAGHRVHGKGTILRGSFGTGFKAPTLSQLNENAFGGNPDLEPEESRGFDLGIEHRLSGGGSVLQLTWFQNRIDEMIVAVFVPATGGFGNLNVDEAETRGVEATFRFDGLARFGLRASYTRTETEARGTPATFGLAEGSELLRRPKHKGAIDLRFRTGGGRGSATLSLLHVGARQDIHPVSFTAVTADSYTVLHASGSLALTGAVQLFGRVENLLDEDYEDVLGFATPGLSAYGGIRFRL